MKTVMMFIGFAVFWGIIVAIFPFLIWIPAILLALFTIGCFIG